MMAGEVIRRKEMKTLNELKLKNLLRKEKGMFGAFMFKEKIQKLTNELVSSESFYFSKTPRNYHKVLEILKKFLDQHHSRWISLTFCFYTSYQAYESAFHPFHSHVNISIFLFGKRDFILRNIKEISGRIVAGNKWIGKEAGISQQELSIQNFL